MTLYDVDGEMFNDYEESSALAPGESELLWFSYNGQEEMSLPDRIEYEVAAWKASVEDTVLKKLSINSERRGQCPGYCL